MKIFLLNVTMELGNKNTALNLQIKMLHSTVLVQISCLEISNPFKMKISLI